MLGVALNRQQGESRFVLSEVPEPVLASDAVLVAVDAFSVNPGEARLGLSGQATGPVIGWDFVGRVIEASDPSDDVKAGDRVVGFVRSGAWAERVVAPSRSVARVPPGIESEIAVTLPTAGLTALYSVTRPSALMGKQVLVTSATGSVGRLACQIAKLNGARVVAASRSGAGPSVPPIVGSDRHIRHDELSAEERFDLVIEMVGGAVLSDAMVRLHPGGSCVSVSGIASEPTTFDAATFMSQWGANLHAFGLYHEEQARPAREGLTHLLGLLQRDLLTPSPTVRGLAREVDAFARGLVERRIKSKPVLVFGDGS